jgi:membrane-associated phospholipid phosphatase
VNPQATTRPLPIRLSRRRRVLTDLARIFSTVCNPFVTSLALFVVLAHEEGQRGSSFWVLLLVSTLFTSIGPMLYVLWLYATDRISDLDMSIRRERERVFVGFVAFYLLGALALWRMHAPSLMVATMWGYVVASLVVQYITRYWKISTHALGITAPLVVMAVLYGTQPLPFLVLIPIVGWSRVYLKAHTLLQVIAGTALGFASVFAMFKVFHIV